MEEGGEVEGRERVAGRGKTKLDVGSHFRSERAKSEEEREREKEKKRKKRRKDGCRFLPLSVPFDSIHPRKHVAR